jgi:hypothetical protein
VPSFDYQYYSSSYDLAPRPPPSPLSLEQVVSFSLSSCVSPVELILTGEEGVAPNQTPLEIIQYSLQGKVALHFYLACLWTFYWSSMDTQRKLDPLSHIHSCKLTPQHPTLSTFHQLIYKQIQNMINGIISLTTSPVL